MKVILLSSGWQGIRSLSSNNPRIDWRLLGEAVNFYEKIGYTYVEVPYIVPDAAVRMTLPTEFAYDEVTGSGGGLVGSAEQSLLSMALNLELPDDIVGRGYVAVTPCFRQEPVLNDLYQRHFMKVELFQINNLNPMALLLDAQWFMSKYAKTQVVRTDEGKDLTVGGIEVGSYGLREGPNGLKWACGTGLALPRFDVARQRQMWG